MSRTVIKNIGHLVTMDATRRELTGVDMALENGIITEIGAGLLGTGIDAAGCVVTPGLVNAHHHLYQTNRHLSYKTLYRA